MTNSKFIESIHKAKFLRKEWKIRNDTDNATQMEPQSTQIHPPTSSMGSSSNKLLVSWKPPPPSFYELNFDSFRLHLAAAGVIISDSLGDPLKVVVYNLVHSQVFVVGALALHHDIILVIQSNIRKSPNRRRQSSCRKYNQRFLVSSLANFACNMRHQTTPTNV